MKFCVALIKREERERFTGRDVGRNTMIGYERQTGDSQVRRTFR